MYPFFVTYILIAITVLVSLKGFSDPAFSDRFMYKPFRQKHFGEHYRIFTHLFLHADPLHLIFNMLALYYFGRLVEMYFWVDFGLVGGTLLYIVFYLLGGLFATLLPFMRHKDNDLYRSVGASGAVSAILFAGIIFQPDMRVGLILIPGSVPAYIFGPVYLLYEFLADRFAKTRIAHDAHIGGAIFGIVFVLITNIDRAKAFLNYFY